MFSMHSVMEFITMAWLLHSGDVHDESRDFASVLHFLHLSQAFRLIGKSSIRVLTSTPGVPRPEAVLQDSIPQS